MTVIEKKGEYIYNIYIGHLFIFIFLNVRNVYFSGGTQLKKMSLIN